MIIDAAPTDGLWDDGLGGTGEWGATSCSQVAALCAEGAKGGTPVYERRPVAGRYV